MTTMNTTPLAGSQSPKTGFVHPLLHINYVEQRPGIEPCFDCGRPMDDNYTAPNRCAVCHAAFLAAPTAPAEVLGADLHEGSVVVDVKGGAHTIDRLAEYPGRFVGDHARVAYGDHWERTIPDHKPFHCLPDNEES